MLTMWPRLSSVYGLHPWDLDRLSVAEWNSYLDDAADIDFMNRGR